MADAHRELMEELSRTTEHARQAEHDQRNFLEAHARQQRDLEVRRSRAAVQHAASAGTKLGGHALQQARRAGSLTAQGVNIAVPAAMFGLVLGYIATRPRR
jgi:hypothetical protein